MGEDDWIAFDATERIECPDLDDVPVTFDPVEAGEPGDSDDHRGLEQALFEEQDERGATGHQVGVVPMERQQGQRFVDVGDPDVGEGLHRSSGVSPTDFS